METRHIKDIYDKRIESMERDFESWKKLIDSLAKKLKRKNG